MDDPIIDLQSDHYFMGEALRQALRAYEAEEVPVGAVVVREGRIIARAFNQVELLKDATAHAEMLAITAAEEAVGNWRHSSSRTPRVMSHWWLRPGNCSRFNALPAAPPFASLAPKTTRPKRTWTMAPAHIGHGSFVT